MSEVASIKYGWSEIRIAGHPCDVYEPPRRNPHGFVLIYLHGVHLNRLIDKQPFIQQFAKHGLPVVAPVTQRSWWSEKLCAEFDSQVTAWQHLIGNVLPWVETCYGAKPPQIGLFGTSMGGQGALRFAFKLPHLFPVIAALSPAIDYQLRYHEGDETIPLMYPDKESARQDTATLHVHPLNWPRNLFFCCDPTDLRWHESTDRLRMKLNALGIPYECDMETSGGGHGFAYYNRMASRAVGFLAEKLETERKRMV